jgi:hypothetical protein
MIKKVLTSLLVIATLLTGCETERRIIIKAAKKTNVSVTVYFTQYEYYHGSPTQYEREQRIIHLPAKHRYRKRLRCGIATWSEDKIIDYSQNIDSIIIHNTSDTIVLKTQPDIYNYLFKHTKEKFSTSLLIIEAK